MGRSRRLVLPVEAESGGRGVAQIVVKVAVRAPPGVDDALLDVLLKIRRHVEAEVGPEGQEAVQDQDRIAVGRLVGVHARDRSPAREAAEDLR